MRTRRIIEGCPELEYYNYKIYVAPESWLESLRIQNREYEKVEGKDIIEEKLEGENLKYGIYLKEKSDWKGLPKSVKNGARKIKRINQTFKINYNGGPVPPFSRTLSSDGKDISHETFGLYLEAIGFKNHEAEYASSRKSEFPV